MHFGGLSRFTQSKSMSLFLILLGLAINSQRLVSAAPKGDNLDTHGRLSGRDDYPSDYPYPKKEDCSAKVTTAADKSLFYTGYNGFGLTAKQMISYKKLKGLHTVGDAFTYPSGYVVSHSHTIIRSLEDLGQREYGGNCRWKCCYMKYCSRGMRLD